VDEWDQTHPRNPHRIGCQFLYLLGTKSHMNVDSLIKDAKPLAEISDKVQKIMQDIYTKMTRLLKAALPRA
jgi:hypothetical protein